MKTKLMIAALAVFAVPAFAEGNCPSGTTDFGGPNSGFNMSGCAVQVNGERTFKGPFTFYWDNGVKQGEGQMVNNKRNGTWTFWTKAGVKEAQVTFKNGKWDGQRIQFNADGSTKSVETYNNGKLVASSHAL